MSQDLRPKLPRPLRSAAIVSTTCRTDAMAARDFLTVDPLPSESDVDLGCAGSQVRLDGNQQVGVGVENVLVEVDVLGCF